MSKTLTEQTRHALNGPTMGTRWQAIFHAEQGFDVQRLREALQAAVTEVDVQMSTWKPYSDLMRLNAAPAGVWHPVPAHLMKVLQIALDIGRASGGAFDIGLGDVTTAWGFGPSEADPMRMRVALTADRVPAHDALRLDVDAGKVFKTASITLDLNGIAKGYGVDRLAETLMEHGITSSLVGVDGEMRAMGLRPDGVAWTIAIEAPDTARRTPQSVLQLQEASVATSGDYRHWVEVQGRKLSHTMAPQRGAPLLAAPASVTVVARSCAEADGWATALMVLGLDKGRALAAHLRLDTLFLLRDAVGSIRGVGVGDLFSENPTAIS
ncbi:MAG: FAD:protein FMN transferase [Paracoccaceae bacterium]